MNIILKPYNKRNLSLKNHLVMAPMTRSRAINNLPNDLMTEYYQQRCGAGLIITEGTSPSESGLGYCRIPGIYANEQIEAWKKITEAVHKNGSKIFVQLMHTGRIGHSENLPSNSKIIAPSKIKAEGKIFTDTKGMQEYPTPEALSTEEVYQVIEEYVQASKNAIKAGFDGIELHGATGYLIEQFLNPHANTRADEFGGSVVNRAHFAISIVKKIADAIGNEKVAIRFSPFSTFNDMPAYDKDEVHETYAYLSAELNKLNIAYLHLSINPSIPDKTMQAIRNNFINTIIICNGFNPDSAEKILSEGIYDLVAFGSLFIANPDLDKRIERKELFNELDPSTFYTPTEKGYTDYPILN